jgi:hypothetical protein
MRPRLCGSPRVLPVRLFPGASGGLAHRPSPSRNSSRFSLPSGRLSFRVPSARPPRRAFARRRHLPRVSALPSTSLRRSQSVERSTAPLAPTPVFSTVRRLLQRSLRACFVPLPSSGLGLVQGSVLSVQPSAPLGLIPPLPFSSGALTCKQAATPRRLDSDVLLHTKPLASGLVFSQTIGLRPSSSFVLLQVHLKPASSVSCPRSLMPLPRGSTSARFQPQTWIPRLRCIRPARAFRTFHSYSFKELEPRPTEIRRSLHAADRSAHRAASG